MSVMSNSVATPNRVFAVLRCLAAAGEEGMPGVDLAARLSPQGLRGKETNMVNDVAKECVDLGLAAKVDRTTYRLHQDLGDQFPEDGLSMDDLRRLLADRVLTATKGEDNWNFCVVVAWLLMQDPLRFDGTNQGGAPACRKGLKGREASVGKLAVNTTNWANVRNWAVFLGLARTAASHSDAGLGIVPDPTPLLRRYMDETGEGEWPRPLSRLMEDAARRWPVLHPGATAQVLAPGPSEGQVYPALAFGWVTLEHLGIVRLIHRSDATDTFVFDAYDNRRVSHVEPGEARVQ